MRLLGDKERLKQIQKDFDVMIRKCKIIKAELRSSLILEM